MDKEIIDLADKMLSGINELNRKINSLPASERKNLEEIQNEVNKTMLSIKDSIKDVVTDSK